MSEPHVAPKLTIPYLDPTVVQAEAKSLLSILTPIVMWLPGSTGNTILAVVTGLADNTALVTAVCDLINQFTGSTPS